VRSRIHVGNAAKEDMARRVKPGHDDPGQGNPKVLGLAEV